MLRFSSRLSKMCANRGHETQSMHKAVVQIPNSIKIDKTSNRHKAQHTHKIQIHVQEDRQRRYNVTMRHDRINTVAA